MKLMSAKFMSEPTHALPGMPKEMSVLIINDTSEDLRQGMGT